MQTQSPRLNGQRILIVEDEYLIASDMAECLQDAGAQIDGPWPDAAQALRSVGQDGGKIAAAVLDIDLGEGGRIAQVADRLDALGVPYVFATGNVVDPGSHALRGRPWLEKPVSGAVLLRAVENLLAAGIGPPG